MATLAVRVTLAAEARQVQPDVNKSFWRLLACSNKRAVCWFLIALFLTAETVRIAAAVWIVRRNKQSGTVHEFADSELYWKLALNIASGDAYDDGKRRVLRTPGYPVFLAGCIRFLGDNPTGARHAQASIGALSCILLFFLVRQLVNTTSAVIAASGAAIYPYAVYLSVTLLSEAIFTFLLLLQLLLLVPLIRAGQRPAWVEVVAAALGGLCGAAATLVRPSWLPFTPLVALVLFLGLTRTVNIKRSTLVAVTMVVAFGIGMCPWWIRNWHVTGHFVPATLWVGASLYDGWNEHATGASDMRFMEKPEVFGLDPGLDSMGEWEQDGYLRREAWQFARSHPWRVIELGAIKFLRFWNPSPNAPGWNRWPMRVVGIVSTGPVIVLAVIGAWRLREQRAVVAMLAGPVLYFCMVHLVFVSSIRYREAAMLPVFGLSAAAVAVSFRREELRQASVPAVRLSPS